jgi:hypothetical protein
MGKSGSQETRKQILKSNPKSWLPGFQIILSSIRYADKRTAISALKR